MYNISKQEFNHLKQLSERDDESHGVQKRYVEHETQSSASARRFEKLLRPQNLRIDLLVSRCQVSGTLKTTQSALQKELGDATAATAKAMEAEKIRKDPKRKPRKNRNRNRTTQNVNVETVWKHQVFFKFPYKQNVEHPISSRFLVFLFSDGVCFSSEFWIVWSSTLHYSMFVFRPKSKRWFWIWKSIRKKLPLWWPAPMKHWPSTRLKLSRAWKLGKR